MGSYARCVGSLTTRVSVICPPALLCTLQEKCGEVERRQGREAKESKDREIYGGRRRFTGNPEEANQRGTDPVLVSPIRAGNERA